MKSIERERLESLIIDLVNHMIEMVPEDALPAFTGRERAKEVMAEMIFRLKDEQLLNLMAYTYIGLDRIFSEVSRDWLMERAGAIKQTQYPGIRKLLEEIQVAFLNV